MVVKEKAAATSAGRGDRNRTLDMRVKDFTYYPLLSDSECAFRVGYKNHTFRQCERYSREQIAGYGFCLKHAQIVKRLSDTQEVDTGEQKGS